MELCAFCCIPCLREEEGLSRLGLWPTGDEVPVPGYADQNSDDDDGDGKLLPAKLPGKQNRRL
ncbi:MAG: hypothetical protein M3Y72_07470 [Acidobacteriota bacterium]|nr:hypothetical protein [Acidobacteriota bacterium]